MKHRQYLLSGKNSSFDEGNGAVDRRHDVGCSANGDIVDVVAHLAVGQILADLPENVRNLHLIIHAPRAEFLVYFVFRARYAQVWCETALDRSCASLDSDADFLGKALVAVCNTATAVAIARLGTEHPHLPIIGVAQFVLQPCDGLADAVERGASSDDATEIIASYARNT